jgi:hypothetical protein
MMTKSSVSLALLVVFTVGLSSAQDCVSTTGNYTVAADFFAGELGKFNKFRCSQ